MTETATRARDSAARFDPMKATVVSLGSIAVLISGLIGIHTGFVVPTIDDRISAAEGRMTEVQRQIIRSEVDRVQEHFSQAIDDHVAHPHPGAVSRKELELSIQLLTSKMDALSDAVKELKAK